MGQVESGQLAFAVCLYAGQGCIFFGSWFHDFCFHCLLILLLYLFYIFFFHFRCQCKGTPFLVVWCCFVQKSLEAVFVRGRADWCSSVTSRYIVYPDFFAIAYFCHRNRLHIENLHQPLKKERKTTLCH